MKAKIKRTGNYWRWYIYSNNGRCVANGGYYTRKDNAKRGLERFINKVTFSYAKLDGVTL